MGQKSCVGEGRVGADSPLPYGRFLAGPNNIWRFGHGEDGQLAPGAQARLPGWKRFPAARAAGTSRVPHPTVSAPANRWAAPARGS